MLLSRELRHSTVAWYPHGGSCAQKFMAEQRDDMTPEECKQRYDEYKADYTQRLTHSFIDVHHNEVRCTTTRETRFFVVVRLWQRARCPMSFAYCCPESTIVPRGSTALIICLHVVANTWKDEGCYRRFDCFYPSSRSEVQI